MPPESPSPEALALQSIAKSLETISKNLASINRLLNVAFAFSSNFDKVDARVRQAVTTWRRRAFEALARRFNAKPSR